MKLRRVQLANIRSFLEPTELRVDDTDIAIVIGPNGGGKTNLLDATATALRRHLLVPWSLIPTSNSAVYGFQVGSRDQWAKLERHTRGSDLPQRIEIEVEATPRDIENMQRMKVFLESQWPDFNRRYSGVDITPVRRWDMDVWKPGIRCTFEIVNNSLVDPTDPLANNFRHYLNLYEVDALLRRHQQASSLTFSTVNTVISGRC